MSNVTEIFGSEVFNDTVMRSALPQETYDALMETITEGKPMSLETANVVASAMKDWALKKGATHYTHWFQPMTGITAEKHDSFISPAEGGKAIMEFSGKELIKGEPDASSFPSGGLRETCEARGYTAWDPSSFAFIKDGTLCVPTAFCSYGGEALDKKTPLLRSMEAINTQAVRVLKLMGEDSVRNINITVGPEQEYFLVDKNLYDMREDLVFTGRTLFGAKPPKGQELDDHYFGVIKPRVSAFMKELDEELWKLGIYAKTKHNEAAPAQHELAPVFTTVNIATDHNQLTMEMMKKVALRHDLVCLLHEKPFAGVNGSGKHNNWSISTDGGENIFKPGKNPHDNKRFILFLCAVIKAVDEYQDLLRVCISTAGNDHRLGGDEAPPAIVSLYLGEQIENILEALENDAEYNEKKREKMQSGAHVIPTFSKDTADRNRTSPLAFTGNKFEFRMLGSANSVAGPNTVFNTIVAEALCQFADELENADDVKKAIDDIIRKTIKKHKRIIFSGNNYSEEWVKEAEKRGLLNIASTPEAIPYLIDKKNIELFTKHAVYNEAELEARCEILLETYAKTVNIEALTMVDMIKKDIIPAVSSYTEEISNAALAKKAFVKSIDTKMEENLVIKLSKLNAELYDAAGAIEKAISDSSKFDGNVVGLSRFYREKVLEAMNKARVIVDELEVNTSREYWPYPTYADLLFSVN
ncbi:MAG: glutamine synthetase III [Clostridia bacterium]|nr:glutamine synthetase III [Clostridia bacterium]MBO7288389.1 glutamine synthetase III [Clostridia bacterium]